MDKMRIPFMGASRIFSRGWGQPENLLTNVSLSCLRILLRIALELCVSVLKQIARHLRMILIVDINSWYTGVLAAANSYPPGEGSYSRYFP
jgi:hypothetical protein